MFLKRFDTCCLYLYGYWGAKMQLKNKNHRKLFGKWCMQTSQICTRLIFFLRYKVHRYCEGVTHKKTYLIFISDSLTQRKFKSWCCVVWYTFQREDRDCSISLTENFCRRQVSGSLLTYTFNSQLHSMEYLGLFAEYRWSDWLRPWDL